MVLAQCAVRLHFMQAALGSVTWCGVSPSLLPRENMALLSDRGQKGPVKGVQAQEDLLPHREGLCCLSCSFHPRPGEAPRTVIPKRSQLVLDWHHLGHLLLTEERQDISLLNK